MSTLPAPSAISDVVSLEEAEAMLNAKLPWGIPSYFGDDVSHDEMCKVAMAMGNALLAMRSQSAESLAAGVAKPPVHAGLIGHVDTAKTTLTAAITKLAQQERKK